MVQRRPRPQPDATVTLADIPDDLLAWHGTGATKQKYLPALTAWNDAQDRWFTEHGLQPTFRELATEHHRRAEAHWAEHPEDRVGRHPIHSRKAKRT